MKKFRKIHLVLLVGVIFAALSIKCGLDSAKAFRDLKEWAVATPIKFVADLSKPGKWTGKFEQVCSSAHSQELQFQTDAITSEDSSVFQGIEGVFRVTDASDKNILVADLIGKDIQLFENSATSKTAHWQVDNFRKGNYRYTLEITSPSQFSPMPTTISLHYNFCGMEQWPATIAELLSIGTGVLALILVMYWVYEIPWKKS